MDSADLQPPANSFMVQEKPSGKFGPAALSAAVFLVFALTVAASYMVGAGLVGKNKAACTQEVKICPDGSSVGRVAPSCEFAECPEPASLPISDWKEYANESAKFTFKMPQNLSVLNIISNTTPLAPDEEYVVSTMGSDLFYLSLFMYKSDKSASDWWATEGKEKFQRLAVEIGRDYSDPPVEINLSYEEKTASLSGKEALEAVVSSDVDTPNTPVKRFLTIVQHNGYIIAVSYKDLGTTESSIDLSRRILSTFEFL